MGGFLGYDPGRLATLRRALAQALTEAATVRCDDPLAADPLAGWRRAVEVAAPWDTRLASILSCGFASPYRSVGPSSPGLPIDDRRLLTLAWTVVTDPMAALPAAVDPLERLDELVALLVGLDPRLLGDPAAVQRLLELLDATFRDDAARAAVLRRARAGRLRRPRQQSGPLGRARPGRRRRRTQAPWRCSTAWRGASA